MNLFSSHLNVSKEDSDAGNVFHDFNKQRTPVYRQENVLANSLLQDSILSPVKSKEENFKISTPLLSILKQSRDNSPFAAQLQKRSLISPISTHPPLTKPRTSKRVKRQFNGGKMNYLTEKIQTPPKTRKVKRRRVIGFNTVESPLPDLIHNGNQIRYGEGEFDQVVSEENQEEKDGSKFSCNCKNSKCLKLYCDCLRNNAYCGSRCNCVGCENHPKSVLRKKRVRIIQNKNPLALKPIITNNEEGKEYKIHHRGCNCKKNGCLKNYCECRQYGVLCGFHCKCVGCKNCIDQSSYNLKKQKRYEFSNFSHILIQKKKDN